MKHSHWLADGVVADISEVWIQNYYNNFLTSPFHLNLRLNCVLQSLFDMAAIALQLICAALLAVGESRPHAGSGHTLPRSGAVSSGLITSTNETTVLTAKAGEPAIVTLDYGRAIEGIPTFEVVSIEGDTSVFEITYAESPAALSIYMVRLTKYKSSSETN